MTDRKLLELAAKVAGYEIQGKVEKMIFEPGHYAGGFVITNSKGGSSTWNPLTDDGDALRLAVKLGIELEAVPFGGRAVIRDDDDCGEYFDVEGDDPYAATRRAIVRAAAEIGRAM